MATRAVMGKAIYLAPLAFAAGLALKEWRDTQKRMDELVEKRVLQRLGEWRPPVLSEQQRQDLLAERENILNEIAKLSRKHPIGSVVQ